ncbi:MAG: hypothetical protein WDO12_07645 [Pseudomonadota bacterium]
MKTLPRVSPGRYEMNPRFALLRIGMHGGRRFVHRHDFAALVEARQCDASMFDHGFEVLAVGGLPGVEADEPGAQRAVHTGEWAQARRRFQAGADAHTPAALERVRRNPRHGSRRTRLLRVAAIPRPRRQFPADRDNHFTAIHLLTGAVDITVDIPP